MADEEEVAAAAPEPVEEVEMSVLDALKEVRNVCDRNLHLMPMNSTSNVFSG